MEDIHRIELNFSYQLTEAMLFEEFGFLEIGLSNGSTFKQMVRYEDGKDILSLIFVAQDKDMIKLNGSDGGIRTLKAKCIDSVKLTPIKSQMALSDFINI